MGVNLDFAHHVDEVLAVAEGQASDRDADVVRSWLRCINEHKLDPERKGKPRIVTETTLRRHQEESEDLIAIARYGMEDLYRRVDALGYVLLLTDPKGVVIDFIGDHKVDRELKRAGLYIGAAWTEDESGTTGVGACLKSGEAITVHQHDHFDVNNTPLSCTAAPIYHHDGSLIGCLDVSLLISPIEKHSQALTLEVVKSCVRRIELANLMASRKSDWILKLNQNSEFLDVDPSAAISVAMDGTISGLTHSAHHLLSDAASEDWSDTKGFIGRPFEDVFDFRADDIPRLKEAETPGERALELCNGDLLFAGVTPPARKKAPTQPTTIPAALSVIHGGDAALDELCEKASRIVDKQISIILEGETGAGKEFIANAIHSTRKQKGQFVAINCAALPEALIESELFGYAPNSFTGAHAKGKKGLIEQANGGTLFLDEVGDMPLALQARLLRVLAEREVLPVGATKPVKVDFRVISASYLNLKDLVDKGEFRQDLYYRLNGVVLKIPPVRDREDLPWLIRKIAKLVSKNNQLTFSAEAEEALLAYDWPGNTREMVSVFELCAALCEGGHVEVSDLPDGMRPQLTES